MPEKLREILDELREADREERIEMLLDFAKRLAPLPERLQARRDAEHRVEECQSPVYLFVEIDDRDRVRLHADVPMEAPTVRGFVALLLEGLDGAEPDEVLKIPHTIVHDAGLVEIIGLLRIRGLTGVVQRVKRETTRALAARAG